MNNLPPVSHSFDINIAEMLNSVELAIIIHHFAFWIDLNTRSKKNFHNGKYWTFQSMEDISNHFPYFSTNQVRRLIEKLVNMNILEKGNFNKTAFDRTVWYAFHDNWKYPIWQNCQMDRADLPNQNGEIDKPIPDTKPDAETEKKEEENAVGESDAVGADLSFFLFEKLRALNPGHKKPNMKTWTDEINRMIRIDQRDPEIIRKVIAWALDPDNPDDFWKTIQSPKTLRSLFDRAYIKMQTSKPKEDKRKSVDKIAAENFAWAKKTIQKLAYDPDKRIDLSDNCAWIVSGRERMNIGYTDPAFREIITNRLRTWGL
jgi:hypothetical protein